MHRPTPSTHGSSSYRDQRTGWWSACNPYRCFIEGAPSANDDARVLCAARFEHDKDGMREIQDMTLNTARGRAGVDALFEERRTKYGELASALRVTGVPVEIIPDPGRMFGRREYYPPLRRFLADINGVSKQLVLPGDPSAERPILRALHAAIIHRLPTFGSSNIKAA